LDRFSKPVVRRPEDVEFAERDVNGTYQYYQVVRARQLCIGCHISLRSGITADLNPARVQPISLAEGQLMGIVKVTIARADQ
jgi:hypothetical protein